MFDHLKMRDNESGFGASAPRACSLMAAGRSVAMLGA